MSAVLTGFKSRSWYDNNNDSTSTSIYLEGCHDAYTGRNLNTHLKLMRVRGGILPAENKGEKYFPCSTGATNYWGDVSRSNYYFQVSKIQGSTTAYGYYLDVPYLKVTY